MTATIPEIRQDQPPQDLAAERAVLGSMIQSARAIADVSAVLTGADFYLPKHETVYDCVLALDGRGDPADPIAVSAELERRGELGRVGGAPYLHTLIATVPTAANADYHAGLVAEKARARRAVAIGVWLADRGAVPGVDLDDLIERARVEIAAVTAPLGQSAALSARVLTRGQLAALPAPRPLIADTIDLATVVVIAGWWGTCKSFVGLDWAASIATGSRWHGRPCEQRRVRCLAGEGAYGLDQRLTSWETARSTRVTDEYLGVLPVAVQLGVPVQVAETCALVRNGGYDVVVIDTIAKSAVGLDENTAQDMGRVVDALYRIREATGDGTVIALHHTGKDKITVRGSSAIEAGVDTVYLTEGDPKSLKLARTKRKDGPHEDILTLTLEPVAGTDSAVLVSAMGADMPGRARDLMSVFVSAFSATGATKADLRAAAEMPSATFSRSLNALVTTGVLVNDGTASRPYYRVVAR